MEAILFVCTLIGGIAGLIQIIETVYKLYRIVQDKNTKKK